VDVFTKFFFISKLNFSLQIHVGRKSLPPSNNLVFPPMMIYVCFEPSTLLEKVENKILVNMYDLNMKIELMNR
jgi:hypothetical protein